MKSTLYPEGPLTDFAVAIKLAFCTVVATGAIDPALPAVSVRTTSSITLLPSAKLVVSIFPIKVEALVIVPVEVTVVPGIDCRYAVAVYVLPSSPFTISKGTAV